MADPLGTVLRIRRVAVDDARRQLVEQLRAEEGAEAELDAATRALAAEEEAAADLLAGDGAVEAYAAWLPIGRARFDTAEARCERARADVGVARAALAAARSAAEAAEALLLRRKEAADAEAAWRAQADMDEIASRLRAREAP